MGITGLNNRWLKNLLAGIRPSNDREHNVPPIWFCLRHAADPFLLINRQSKILHYNTSAGKLLQCDALNCPTQLTACIETEQHSALLRHWLADVDPRGGVFPEKVLLLTEEKIEKKPWYIIVSSPEENSRLLLCSLRPERRENDRRHDPGDIPVSIIYCRQGRVLSANAAAIRLFAASHGHYLEGHDFIQRLSRTSRPVFKEALDRVLRGESVSSVEVEIVRMDYEPMWVELSILGTDDAETVQLLLHSIHKRKKDEIRLTWLSYYDALTELPNRRLFMERLKEALNEARQQQTPLSILYFDLDRFKYVNDSLGHAAGDEVLRITAMRLQQVLRDSDLPVRLGGDEFVALLHGANADTARHIANKLLFSLRQSYDIEGRQLVLGGSIGIASFPEDGEDSDTLVSRADAAMYHAKKNRLGIYFFAHDMEAGNKRRLYIEQELVRPDVHHELSVAYQGQYALQANGQDRLIGVEALLRWQHPKLGEISPDEFIPLAEECGQIHTIFPWLIDQCARQAVRWQRRGIRPPKIAINISSTQLMQMDVAAEIIGRIVNVQANPRWFELELTETTMMRDADMAIKIMREWVETGISIAMDDYGTGYSSLSYIKRLPISTIKLDQSFVSQLPGHEEDAAIVRSTIAIAHTLGKKLLAEGVETAAQRDFLLQEGCNAAQGFYFQRPMTAEQTSAYLNKVCKKR